MRRFACLFLLAIFGLSLSAQDSIQAKPYPYSGDQEWSPPYPVSTFYIDSFQHEIDLRDYTEVLFDPGDKFSIEDLLRDSSRFEWTSLRSHGTWHFPSDDLPWARLRISNRLSGQSLWALTFNFLADTVKAYVVDEQGNIERFMQGKTLPPSRTIAGIDMLNREYDSKMPAFIRLHKGETKTIYFKVYNATSADAGIRPILRTVENLYYHQSEQRSRYVKAFFYQGMIWMFILLNLAIFFFYKDKSYLFLALYALCFSFPNDLSSVIYAVKTWMPEYPFMVSFRWVVLNPLVYVTGALFMRIYLNSKALYPRTDRYLKIILGLGLVYFFASVINYLLTERNFINHSYLYAAVMSLITFMLFVLIIVDLRKVKKTSVRFWLAATSWLLIFHILPVIPMLLGDSQLVTAIDNFFHPYSSTGIGVLGQIFIFTLGLGFQSREIAREKEDLESRDKLKSRFFANISHEFRTPLTLVLGPLAQLIERAEKPEEKQLLELAHRNAARQLSLINQILELSKLEAGKLKLQAQESDLIPALKGMVFSYESLAEQRNIELLLACDDETLPVFIDKEKTETIFYNLLSNAFKFTPDGGTIAVRQYSEAGKVHIQVSDTGVGISKEKLPHIFDRFFQAESGSNEYEGTGIGLALVKELIQLHKGSISVHSEPGEGTAFTLTFPLGKGHLKEDEIVEKADSSPFMLQPIEAEASQVFEETTDSAELPHILLIEDNADMRVFIRQRLEGNFRISEATDGEQGVQAAFDNPPDLIISDVMMPKKDGYAVCAILKGHSHQPHPGYFAHGESGSGGKAGRAGHRRR
ncbi:MAG: ATP-binding protein [Bacteroidia bacterium]